LTCPSLAGFDPSTEDITGAKTPYRCGTRRTKGTCTSKVCIREDVLRAGCLAAISEEIRTPANIEYVREQVAEKIENHGREIKNELEHRRERVKRAGARLKQLVDFVGQGMKSKKIRTEIEEVEARIEADTNAIERLVRELGAPIALPDPEEITAQAFRVHDVALLDIDRARQELVRWLMDGAIRVRETAGGIEITGTVYPLLTIFRPDRKIPTKKPKGSESLGGGLSTVSSGGPKFTANATISLHFRRLLRARKPPAQ
jgi:hypothetical protein